MNQSRNFDISYIEKAECWKAMYCQNRIVYTVQEGDSLYQLARQYHTTVTELILGNPGINPYNLQIGMKMYICPGEEYREPIPQNPMGMSNSSGNRPNMNLPDMGMSNPSENRPNMNSPDMGMSNPPENRPNMNPPDMSMPNLPENRPNADDKTENERENMLENEREAMRLAWLDLIYWTRMYLMSVDAESDDRQSIEERVLQAADEITDVFAEALPIAATRQLRNLLAGHVELTNELIRQGKERDTEDYDALIREWYANANQLAELLGQINPYFNDRETRNILLNYLDLTRESIEQQMNGEYGQSIETFRDLKKHVLEMADYFARGLLAR